MELNLQRHSITIQEAVYDGKVEQPIECDALLPDYCPDIVKVLKCTVVTHIGSTVVSGNRLTIEGMAVANVFYASDSGVIRHADYKIPFSKVCDLRTAPTSPEITVSASVDYLNCRAVNGRRLDVRGAISLAIKVIDHKPEEIISSAQGGGLQLRQDMVKATETLGQTESVFSISENLEIGYGKAQVNSIIRSDCRVNVQDYKIIAGKVVVKGDFMLHICYQPREENAKLEVMEYSLPISQIIDSDTTDELCVCDVEMYVVTCDVQPKTNEDGEYRLFELNAKIKGVVTSHRHVEIPVASDCYSTMHDCKCSHKQVQFMRLIESVRESIIHKVTLDLPEGIECVLDCWSEVESLSWKPCESAVELAIKLNVSMFAQMQDGQVQYFEQLTEMQHKLPVATDCENIRFDPTSDILSCAYNLAGKEKIDIRCEVIVKGCIFCPVMSSTIKDITVDETAIKPKPTNKLFIYYADQGESVWDIAKHYNTSAGAIWEENAVESDILGAKAMLLIPIV